MLNIPKTYQQAPGSFRDPSGFVFFKNKSIFRQVNSIYKSDYDFLHNSGLYKNLIDSNLLIPHEEIALKGHDSNDSYKIIKPEIIPFISYPYEWCFSQLKDAALLTLEIQKRALNYGMSLKDSSAYNIQFKNGKPIFIDTLSFEIYTKGKPWTPYKQFCQHFLAPLALMSFKDIRLSGLMKLYIDGIPLDLASLLLPLRSNFNFSSLIHIHLHAKAQKHFSAKCIKRKEKKISRLSLMGLIDSLESSIKKLKYKRNKTEWGDYYENTNYSPEGFIHKKQIVSDLLNKLDLKVVWDLGSNTGEFSRIAADKKMQVISFDSDPLAVEKNYQECISKHESHILPLLIDLTNPSSNIGWNNEERISLLGRGPADIVLALALIHHLAISNNLPLHKIADFFSKTCNSLIIEFIPKDDSQVQRLLTSRKDIFIEYYSTFF